MRDGPSNEPGGLTITSASWGAMTVRQGASLCRAIAVGLSLLGMQTASNPLQAQSRERLLDTVGFELTGVTDSTSYLLYRYRIINPASSRGGVAGVELDVSASRGVGHVALPFTGSRGPTRRDVPDHVPFGAIAPERWQMLVDWKARLLWYVYEILAEAPVSFDSVAPGAVKSGFGVRSPYLPGVREFAAIPTEQSCCTKPNAQGELPTSFLFRVRGYTVAPTYAPDKITLQVLGDLLARACGDLSWISQGGECERFQARLAPAREAEQRGDREAAKGSLHAFVAELDAHHGSGKPINDNAYWLLKVNAEYLLAHM